MVDATTIQDLELYRDPTSADRFLARDPSDGTTYAVPFEEIESTNATVTNNLTVNGTTSTGALEADNITITQDNQSNIIYDSALDVDVPGGSFETIFDATEGYDVISGTINSYAIGDLRATWADGSTDRIQTGDPRGETQGNVSFSTKKIPPIKNVKKLEVDNKSSNTQSFGWEVLRI